MNYQFYQGPEGISFLCSNSHHNYVTVVDEKVTCPECSEIRPFYFAKQVTCASPDHNDPAGCTNPACFKAVTA